MRKNTVITTSLNNETSVQEQKPKLPVVLVYGSHELSYPRNRTMQEVMQKLGWKIRLNHSRAPFPLRHWVLLKKFLKISKEVDFIYMTEGSHRLVPLVNLFNFRRKPIVFDPFLSRFNSRIEDRKESSPRSLEAFICKWQDWSSTRSADLLLYDTRQHQRYFESHYHIKKPGMVFPVLVNEEVFKPMGFHAEDTACFRVCFYGTYIPLQGIDTILHAAKEVQIEKSQIRFYLLGEGQTKAEMLRLAEELSLSNVEFLEPVAEKDLGAFIESADLLLGIFDQGIKASQVVPNKVVQGAACGKPMITRDSESIADYFREGHSICTVPAANPKALAQKIIMLQEEAHVRRQIGIGARKVFEKEFSKKSAEAKWRTVWEKLQP